MTKPTFGDRRGAALDRAIETHRNEIAQELRIHPCFLWPKWMRQLSTDEREWAEALGRWLL